VAKSPIDPREPKPDGRRNNRTPVHGRIKPGEVRSPNGRRGKANHQLPTTMDEILWEESKRVVSHDSNGPVTAQRRLYQDEFFDAFNERDPAIRARLITTLQETSVRIEQEWGAILAQALDRQRELREEFHLARKMRRSPPDVLPHPEHVQLSGSSASINGPECRASRESWEWLKALIKVAACLHDLARKAYSMNPSPEVLQDLEAYAAHRRKLMRQVPKGWNWRENIWTRDSKAELAAEAISSIMEIGYVHPQVED